MIRLAIDPLAWGALRQIVDTVYIHVQDRVCGRGPVTVERQGRLSMHMHAMLYGGMVESTNRRQDGMEEGV